MDTLMIENEYEQELLWTIETLVLENKIHNKFYVDKDGFQKSLLMLAVEINSLPAVKKICNVVDISYINYMNNAGETALSYSLILSNYDLEIVEYLLYHGANPNISSSNGCNILRALNNPFSMDALWLLIIYGANINHYYSPNILGICITQNRLDVVFELFNYGVDPNVPDHFGISALGYAASSKYTEIFHALIMHDANPLALQGECRNIIMLAAQSGSYNVLKTILKLISSDYSEHMHSMIHHIDPYGNTPLIYAIQSGSHRKVNILIEYGASVNPQYPNNNFLIYYAIKSGNKKIIRILFHAGIKITGYILKIVLFNKDLDMHTVTINEFMKHILKMSERRILNTLQKKRDSLIDCGMPFDIAIKIAHKVLPEWCISDHIRKIDIQRAIAFYNQLH